MDADLRAAIAETVNQSQYLESITEELNRLPEDEAPEVASAPAAEEEVLARDDDPATEGEPEGEVTTTDTEATEEPPMEYWGTSLEGLSAEQRAEVIAALEQRDSEIQKLQQRLAREPEAVTPEPTPEPAEITDDDILRALGINPEGDPFEVEYARKYTLPLAKQTMALEETVETLRASSESQQVVSYWNTALDKLEADYGALPGDRRQVLQYAADEGIGDPEVLYLRLSAPIKKTIDSQVAKIRQQAAKKVASGQMRPRSTSTAPQEIDGRDKTLREVVREAAIAAQDESGIKWKDIFRSGGSAPS